jgi:hypothetical protein
VRPRGVRDDPRTVAKMLAFSVPPGYRACSRCCRSWTHLAGRSTDPDGGQEKSRPAKQQHTGKRIFERLDDEHQYGGGITIARAYVHEHRQRLREMFVPLSHEPGHAEVDFGEELAVIAGEERKIHFLCDGAAAQRCLSGAGLSGRTAPKSSLKGTTSASSSSAECRVRFWAPGQG